MAQFDNSKTFAHDDDSVVVIIGSGAGGGTLANELAQQGIDATNVSGGIDAWSQQVDPAIPRY
mgnify:CR=1 FL=1